MRRNVSLVITVFVLVSFLAACAPAAPTAAPTKPAASAATSAPAATTAPVAAATKPAAAAPVAKIKRGGTIVWSDYDDVNSWDPAFSTNSTIVAESPALETLVRWELIDENTGKHEAKPGLAESWDMSDPKTIVLKLQKGVKFHDGSEFNAEAAKWRLDRSREHAKSLGKGFQASVDSVVATDASTLRINLKAPSAIMLINLTNAAAGSGSTGTMMTSKVAFEKLGEDGVASKPVGTGPFVMEEWKRDDKALYKRWDQYWKMGEDGKALPYYDRVEYRRIPDSSVAALELRAGTVQVASTLNAKDIPSLKSNPDLVTVVTSWAARRHSQQINPKNEPLGKNLKLRQALQYAIDREAVAKTMGAGYYVPDYHNVWIPAFPGWDDTLPKYAFNLEKAKGLVAEAGFASGVDLTLSVPATPIWQQLGEISQAMWSKAGIRAKIDVLDMVAWKDQALANRHQINEIGHTPSPDPDGMSRIWLCDGSANWGQYCNPEMDKCLVEGRSVYDFKQRSEIYKRCQKILYEDAMMYGLAMEPFNFAYRKEIKGLKVNQYMVDLRGAWIDK